MVAFPETEKQIIWILEQSFTISLLYGLDRDHQIRLNINSFNQRLLIKLSCQLKIYKIKPVKRTDLILI